MRKGQGLPMSTIVVTALSLLVLVVIGAFFLSGMAGQSKSMAGWITQATGGDEQAIKARCQSECVAISGIVLDACDKATIEEHIQIVEFLLAPCHCYITCELALSGSAEKCKLTKTFGADTLGYACETATATADCEDFTYAGCPAATCVACDPALYTTGGCFTKPHTCV